MRNSIAKTCERIINLFGHHQAFKSVEYDEGSYKIIIRCRPHPTLADWKRKCKEIEYNVTFRIVYE